MSYEVRFAGKALVQLRGLPTDAFQALLARVVDLVDAPWDAELAERGGDTTATSATPPGANT
jgi:hypothetical protein